MEDVVTVDREFLRHLLDCLKRQKSLASRSESEAVGNEQDAIDRAWRRGMSILSGGQSSDSFRWKDDVFSR